MPSIQGSRTVTGTTTPNDIGYTDVGVLPNITGILHWAGSTGVYRNSGYDNGVFYKGNRRTSGIGGTDVEAYDANFDASRSSNIYNSNYQEVQPKRILMYYIIKYI